MQEPKAKLTEGPVGRHLVDMTVPVLLGVGMMMGQAFIDAWFLGRVGDRALAAHAFAFPILMIVTSVAIGLGAGTSSVVARAIGANDLRRARRLATDSLFLSFLITAGFCILGVLTINPLFRLLGAPDDMIPMIRSFMLILYSGVPFVVVGMVGMASMRATGDTRLPSKLMILGSVLNVLLDPIFIFGFGPVPALGLNGAAVAALLARGVIFVGALYLLRGRLNMISLATAYRRSPSRVRFSYLDDRHQCSDWPGCRYVVGSCACNWRERPAASAPARNRQPLPVVPDYCRVLHSWCVDDQPVVSVAGCAGRHDPDDSKLHANSVFGRAICRRRHGWNGKHAGDRRYAVAKQTHDPRFGPERLARSDFYFRIWAGTRSGVERRGRSCTVGTWRDFRRRSLSPARTKVTAKMLF